MDTGIDSNTKIAKARVNRSLNRLEQSMDQLVGHISHTRDSVDHARELLRRPARWARQAMHEIRREPALYFAIAWALGLTFYASRSKSLRGS